MKKFILLLMMLGLSVSAFSQKWEKVVSKNIIDDYQKFVQKNPNSEYAPEAIERMMYLKAVESKEDAELKAYLEKYPQTPRATVIETYYSQVEFLSKQIDFEDNDWENNDNRLKEYDYFLKTYEGWPDYEKVVIEYFVFTYKANSYTFNRDFKKVTNSDIIKAVNERLVEVKFNIALKSKSTWKMEEYIKEYPNTSYANIMQDSLDALNTANAKKEYENSFRSTQSMRAYIRNYPNTTEAKIVTDSLLEREYSNVMKSKDVYTMEQFLLNYHYSKYESEIKQLLYDSLYSQVTKQKSYPTHKKFLKHFPDDAISPQLKSELYELHLEYARDRSSAREEFLKEYPDSNHIEEIECLIACDSYKEEDLNAFLQKYPNTKYQDLVDFKKISLKQKPGASQADYEAFILKYPNSTKVKDAESRINNFKFAVRFAEIVGMLESKWGTQELLDKIDFICQHPSNSMSYDNFKKFGNALKNYESYSKKNENAKFMYAFMELCYHANNAAARSSMVMMVESVSGSSMAKIDVFQIIKASQSVIDLELAMLLVDNDVDSKRRGYQGLQNILNYNVLPVSKMWSDGEKLTGMQIIITGIPINLKGMKEILEKIQKVETDAENLDLIDDMIQKLSKYYPTL